VDIISPASCRRTADHPRLRFRTLGVERLSASTVSEPRRNGGVFVAVGDGQLGRRHTASNVQRLEIGIRRANPNQCSRRRPHEENQRNPSVHAALPPFQLCRCRRRPSRLVSDSQPASEAPCKQSAGKQDRERDQHPGTHAAAPHGVARSPERVPMPRLQAAAARRPPLRRCRAALPLDRRPPPCRRCDRCRYPPASAPRFRLRS
jgi:hypothetical protein